MRKTSRNQKNAVRLTAKGRRVASASALAPAEREIHQASQQKYEEEFLTRVIQFGDATLIASGERQYRFDPTRKWAFDFAWVKEKIYVEIEGGTAHIGREHHNRDAEKRNAATLQGWVGLVFTVDTLQARPEECVGMLNRLISLRRGKQA